MSKNSLVPKKAQSNSLRVSAEIRSPAVNLHLDAVFTNELQILPTGL